MDDTELARMMFPQLSSVSLGSAERGRRAAELLLQRIADPALPPRREQVAPHLAVRASSAAPALSVPAPASTNDPAPAPRTPEVTALTTVAERPDVDRADGPRAARSRSDRMGIYLLLLPALLPVVLSVFPLMRGIYLGFTDARAGSHVETSFTGLPELLRAAGTTACSGARSGSA